MREVYYCTACGAVESYTDDGGETWVLPNGELTDETAPNKCPSCSVKLSGGGGSGDCLKETDYKIISCKVGLALYK